MKEITDSEQSIIPENSLALEKIIILICGSRFFLIFVIVLILDSAIRKQNHDLLDLSYDFAYP